MLPPKLCTTGDKAPAVCAGDLTHHPRAELSLAGYHAYVHKYAKALQLCDASGVPKYTIWHEGKMLTNRVYTMGQIFLLFASVWAFAWCYTVAHTIARNKEVYADITSEVTIADEAEIQFKDLVKWEHKLYYFVHLVFLCMCVLVFIWLVMSAVSNGPRDALSPAHEPEDDQYLETQLENDTDLTLQFFRFFWYLVMVILLFGQLFFWQQWYNRPHDEGSKQETEDLKHEVEHLIDAANKWTHDDETQANNMWQAQAQFKSSSAYNVGVLAESVLTTNSIPYTDYLNRYTGNKRYRKVTQEPYNNLIDSFNVHIWRLEKLALFVHQIFRICRHGKVPYWRWPQSQPFSALCACARA
jgi:hypothetical protein